MPQETNTNFNAIDCNFSRTARPNGFITEINGEDPQEEWRTANGEQHNVEPGWFI